LEVLVYCPAVNNRPSLTYLKHHGSMFRRIFFSPDRPHRLWYPPRLLFDG